MINESGGDTRDAFIGRYLHFLLNPIFLWDANPLSPKSPPTNINFGGFNFESLSTFQRIVLSSILFFRSNLLSQMKKKLNKVTMVDFQNQVFENLNEN